MIPTITKPTRITPTSATLIDNIYVRHNCPSIFSGIIPYNISDHFPVFCFTGRTKLNTTKNKKPLTFIHRPIDTNAIANINVALMNTDWSYLYNLDTDASFTEFTSYINALISKFAPEKEVVIPAKHIIRDERMTKGLMKSSNTLTKLYTKSIKKSKTAPEYDKYVKFRNMYNKLKRCAKESYYAQRFEKYKNDIKGTWKLLNSLTGRLKDKTDLQQTFNVNGNCINDPKEIAHGFCDYFTNIGPNLANDIPSHNEDFKHYLKFKNKSTCNSIFLSPTDPDEIYKILLLLKPKKSTGHDNLSSAFLKDVSQAISIPISILINKSFSNGIVPCH